MALSAEPRGKRWFRCTCRILRRRDGHPYRVVGAMRDISDERLAQETQVQQEAFYRMLSQNVLCEISLDLEKETWRFLDVRDAQRHQAESALTWEELVEHYVTGFVTPADQDRLRRKLSIANLREDLRDANRLTFSVRRKREGAFRWYENVYLCVDRTPQGEARTVLVYLQDVTEMLNRESREDRLRREGSLREELLFGLNKLVEWFVVVEPDSDQYSYYQYRTDRTTTAYPEDGTFSELIDLMSRHMKPMYVYQTMREAFDPALMKERLTNFNESYRVQCVSLDGKTAFTDISVVAMKKEKNGPARYLLIAQDNTTHIRTELKIRRTLQLACNVAKNASEAKTKFLSNMSHDIRTPMNAIVGMTAIAEMNMSDQDRVRYCLDKISQSSHYLLGLINEVLDLSRIESGSVKVAAVPFSLKEMLQGVQNIVKGPAEEKHHEMTWRTDEVEHDVVLGDVLHVQQVLLNLVSNAVKYTPENGRIDVRMSTELVEDGNTVNCWMRVTDNGVGMSKKFQAHLFEPFCREEKPFIQNQQGTGIGLSITKNIVLLMGGSIDVVSAPDKGSMFEVKLHFPVVRDAAAEGVHEEPEVSLENFSDADYSGRVVLLAEDNEINAEIAKEILKTVKIEVDWAENGRRAVELVRENPKRYDLVLMDIQMPVMTGFEAARAIRSLPDESARTVPIVAMTASVFAEDIAEVKGSGMDGHLGKPIDLARLSAELRRWLGANAAKRRG